MANKILVVLEQREGQLKKVSFEVAKAGSDLASKLSCDVEAVIVGSDITDINKIGNYGISKVTHLRNSEFANYSASGYSQAVSDFVKEINADVLIIGNTSMGKDLAPRITAKLDGGIAMDVTALEVDGGEIIATRPIYAGKALIDVKVNSDIKVFTIRPNVFNPGEPNDSLAEVSTKDVDVNLKDKVVETKQASGKLDVAEASIIVSGGRGMKDAESFKLVEDLAEVLGAAVGASRAVVDAGWRPHGEQVGQTGKTVSPNLYVALGISGAIQHLAGMRSSKYIVAINKDADAPIFQVADYGITGDVFEVVPALIEELKK
ncbi:MAG: electron transfer flavoprotein subunit alpha/FixB family protein [Melioribacteraceae bacterium]